MFKYDTRVIFFVLLFFCCFVSNAFAGKKEEKTFRLTKIYAEKGNVHFQLLLSEMYLEEKYNKYNEKESLKWLLKATNQNNKSAIYRVADYYYKGFILQKDYVKSFNYMKKAAKSGSQEARTKLAVMYEIGLGTKKNIIAAYHWGNASCFTTGLHYAKHIEKKMTKKQIEIEKNNSEKLFRKYADPKYDDGYNKNCILRMYQDSDYLKTVTESIIY
jgi:hypothetical protein